MTTEVYEDTGVEEQVRAGSCSGEMSCRWTLTPCPQNFEANLLPFLSLYFHIWKLEVKNLNQIKCVKIHTY